MGLVRQASSTTEHFDLPVLPRSQAWLANRSGLALLVLLAATACFCLQAHADPLPPCTASGIGAQEQQDDCAIANPGGEEVVSFSTSATISYADTAVTNTVTDYSTTLLALLNGVQVYSMTSLEAFTDPTVTSAITAEDATLSADGASFGSPSLLSSNSALLSSISASPATYSCQDAEGTGQTYESGTSITTSYVYGPATMMTGDCNTDTFFVNADQTDININTDTQYTIPETVTTTDTYLDSQTYEIVATTPNTAPAVTPEPVSFELALTGLGAIGWLRRRRQHRS